MKKITSSLVLTFDVWSDNHDDSRDQCRW